MDLLPWELWLNIFEFLDIPSLCRASRVCLSWHDTILPNENYWKQIIFSSIIKNQESVTDELMIKLARRGGNHLLTLDASDCQRISWTGMPNLNLSSLTTLNLRNCESINQTHLLMTFEQGLPSLRYLNLAWVPAADDTVFTMLGNGKSSSITVLNIRGCFSTDMGIRDMLIGLPLLEVFDVGVLPYSRLMAVGRVSDVTLGNIGKYCSERIKIVNICGRRSPTMGGIRRLVDQCPSLRLLDITSCPAAVQMESKEVLKSRPGLVIREDSIKEF